jgi:Arc/MetJ-type ribon-helix-helix transcriptional regulator
MIEIQKPELERRVLERIQSGLFHDVDELLEKALDALEKRTPAPSAATGASLLAVLQASPYPEIDLAPRRKPPHHPAHSEIRPALA